MADTANPTSGASSRLRASDADRDRIAHLLSDALIEGRLSQEEHADRIEAVYAAKTMDDLAELTQDLPSGGPEREVQRMGPVAACASDQALLDTTVGSENIIAILGVAERRSRWLVEPRTNASAAFGSIELDLREAVLAQRDVTVQCALFCGGVRLVLPQGVRVTADSAALQRSISLGDYVAPAYDGAPTVHLTGVSVISGIEVTTQAA
ncbi:hypothetical protein F4561_005498 [Lipingzhangella halophila]|uniref:DUF1707 domain-containing protein n=1 Tax=Lipingzhangella halophila TaxID=1783352 RepID=A0A7W7W5F5_9ACTN|nr:DUF1707 domain-containing protein [Lipingzhangella halophila]MBB4934678.1 hypothetical protein [Lipingzhangella halophila]